MATWSVYRLDTGVFTGAQLGGDQEFVAANTHAGCAVWLGEHDPQRVRVNVQAGVLVPYQPPKPADTAAHAWAWDATSWAWAATPTPAALASDARAERDRRLAACDWVVMRAQDLGQPVPTAWSAYRQALREVPQQAGFPADVEWPALPG